ncbi:hypothetical protein IE53DRAFT_389072 [Violaceomyces palustris]|uniref:Uncharacterized protein n=1 Tax=Violaceomyces palustris TaxID=1673888 RepID=A0ACD0NSI6_9BASI|nr:hypothetical protein IE53DRAFT_389072 [Violaceomyces palustris]
MVMLFSSLSLSLSTSLLAHPSSSTIETATYLRWNLLGFDTNRDGIQPWGGTGLQSNSKGKAKSNEKGTTLG